jgi:C4-dicarboxylate transporter, DctM subunit
LLVTGLIIFIILLFIGAPIWLALGMSGGFWALALMGLPLENVPAQFYTASDSWILLAAPYFLIAGNLMTYMGSAKSLLKFINNLVGHLPGGLPAAAVITCTMFGALSGSTVATVIAVGSLIIPKMIESGYSKQNSMGIVAASGTLGAMIPPSIFMILFASIVNLDVSQIFIAGIVPGIIIAIVLIIVAVFVSARENSVRKRRSSAKEIWLSFIESIPAMLMPIIILGGIYGGIFTPTEAAAVAVFYVLIISFIFYRKDFTASNFKKSLKNSMITTAVIYIILGGAKLFSTALTYAKIPQEITEFVGGLPFAPWVTMLLILALLFVFGMFLDPVAIIFIAIPILYPSVLAMGYDPIHFAIIVVSMLMISQVTPPVGGSLFALSGHFKENIMVVIKGSVPYIYALVVATLIILYVPWLSTFLVK